MVVEGAGRMVTPQMQRVMKVRKVLRGKRGLLIKMVRLVEPWDLQLT